MPKVDGPLFSLEASGTFDKLITYQRYKGGTRVIAKPKPTNAPSQKQIYNRYLMQRLRAEWANQTADAKSFWNQQAQINGLLSGYNAYIQFWFRTIAQTGDRALMLPLNENSGETVFDLSSHMTTATLKNFASGDDISWTDGKNHKLGPALNFPGFGTVVEVSDTEHLATQQFTLEAWIKASAVSSNLDCIYCIDRYPYGLWLSISSSMNVVVMTSSSFLLRQTLTSIRAAEEYRPSLAMRRNRRRRRHRRNRRSTDSRAM